MKRALANLIACAVATLMAWSAVAQQDGLPTPHVLALIPVKMSSLAKLRLEGFEILEMRGDVIFIVAPSRMSIEDAATLAQSILPELAAHRPLPAKRSELYDDRR